MKKKKRNQLKCHTKIRRFLSHEDSHLCNTRRICVDGKSREYFADAKAVQRKGTSVCKKRLQRLCVKTWKNGPIEGVSIRIIIYFRDLTMQETSNSASVAWMHRECTYYWRVMQSRFQKTFRTCLRIPSEIENVALKYFLKKTSFVFV